MPPHKKINTAKHPWDVQYVELQKCSFSSLFLTPPPLPPLPLLSPSFLARVCSTRFPLFFSFSFFCTHDPFTAAAVQASRGGGGGWRGGGGKDTAQRYIRVNHQPAPPLRFPPLPPSPSPPPALSSNSGSGKSCHSFVICVFAFVFARVEAHVARSGNAVRRCALLTVCLSA